MATDSQALALPPEIDLPDPRELARKITKVDKRRWAQYRYGLSLPAIAAREKVPLHRVEASIQKFHVYLQSNSHEMVDAKANSISLQALDEFLPWFRKAVSARRLVSGYGPNGEDPIFEPDIEMGFKAMDALIKLIDKVRPDTPTTEVNVNQFANQTNVNTGERAETLESIIRKVRGEEGVIVDAVPVNEYKPEEDRNLIDESAEEEAGDGTDPNPEAEPASA